MAIRAIICARDFDASKKGDVIALIPVDGVTQPGSKEVPPDFVRVLITDSGYTMDQAFADRVFEALEERQYRVPDNVIDQIIAAGGEISLTRAQVISGRINRGR